MRPVRTRPFRQMAASQESLKTPSKVEENSDPILRDCGSQVLTD